MIPCYAFTSVCLAAGFNWHGFFFLLFAAAACGLALAVVFTDNVVRMAFHLVLSLSATAGLFFLAGAEFVGAMQLMIYVGGTLVLLVFGVMLTAQAPFLSIATPSGEKLLAAVVGVALFAILLRAAVSQPAWREPPAVPAIGDRQPSATPIGMALVGVRVDDVGGGESSPKSGEMLSGYLLPFEVVSVHLLVVLVGAAYLARAKRRRTPRVIESVTDDETPAADASMRSGRTGERMAVVSGEVDR